jgi:SnoaL-like domain
MRDLADPRDTARLRELVDKQDITEVVFRFARGLDRCDWDLVLSCFHPRATIELGVFRGLVTDYVPWVSEYLPKLASSTMHTVHNVLVELDGDAATGESYIVGHHRHATADGETDLVAGGRYLDRFERRNGVWKLTARLLVWEWSREEPATGTWDGDASTFTYGRRDRTDPSYTFGRDGSRSYA